MGEESRLTLIHRLFDAVQDVSAERRPEVLSGLCQDDSVRREVLDLFSHDSPTAMDGVQQIVSRTLSFTPDGPPQIPGVELEEIIGAGAMGVVYRGTQAQPKRSVAVKVLRGGHPSGSVVRRFKAEAEALARLRHSGIATVFEAGVDESESGARPYLIMELVEGEPLDTWMRSNRPGVRATLRLAQKICDAVQHAHSRGVIHRDLKPSNILVTREGQPKLVDFGVARISDPSSTLTMHTMVGEMVGTLAYMSPEQFSGDPTSVDTRSDVYALGVILFSMLTGELPHDVTTRASPKRPGPSNPNRQSALPRCVLTFGATSIPSSHTRSRKRRSDAIRPPLRLAKTSNGIWKDCPSMRVPPARSMSSEGWQSGIARWWQRSASHSQQWSRGPHGLSGALSPPARPWTRPRFPTIAWKTSATS